MSSALAAPIAPTSPPPMLVWNPDLSSYRLITDNKDRAMLNFIKLPSSDIDGKNLEQIQSVWTNISTFLFMISLSSFRIGSFNSTADWRRRSRSWQHWQKLDLELVDKNWLERRWSCQPLWWDNLFSQEINSITGWNASTLGAIATNGNRRRSRW